MNQHPILMSQPQAGVSSTGQPTSVPQSQIALGQPSMAQQQQLAMQPQQQQQQQQMQMSQQPQQHHQPQLQQVPLQQQQPPPQSSQSKELNTVSLCRIGQETVQDIVSRTQEVFQTLKSTQPPNGTMQGNQISNEKQGKIQEQLRTIRLLFKRLRLLYEKTNESCQLQGMQYTHIESLIPYKGQVDSKMDEKKSSESYRIACEEHKEIYDQVVLKNRHLKEIIDYLRRIICEINTMLTMRRS